TTLYVTLEPCTMCAAAISFARIDKIVIGALDEKGGGVLNGVKFFESKTCHFKPEILSGVLEGESSDLLKNFFKNKRHATL
ncbi:MAG: nucleoside deaminase, partial [Alphaproteobacteria bacterium]|nr:nucleoside deaminase [Alphaproteobacteria bacterium]